MTTATLSTRGQLVIPAPVRNHMGYQPGDVIAFEINPDSGEVILRRVETLDEMSARFNSWIEPGIAPLEDTREFFDQRPYRR